MILAAHVRSTAPTEAESIYQRPVLSASEEPFLFQQHIRGDERASITRFQISSTATTSVEGDGILGIGHLHAGHFRAESNGTKIDASRAFVLRPGQARSWSTGMDLTTVNFSLDALTRYADSLLRHPARIDGTAARSPEAARYGNRALAHVTDVFRDDALLHHDLIRRSTIDLLYSAALTTFTSPNADDAGGPPHPAAVRRVVQFIDDHAADPITVADIAAAARLTPRGLEAAFRRALDTTPSARLREVRPAHTHADLLAGTPATSSVATIARRWGFTHLGRFGTTYRSTYHQLPRETLNQ